MANKDYKLDLIDKKVIKEMDMDCRRPSSLIAKNIRISQQRLQYRLKSLQEQGIIPIYYTLIDSSMFGYTFYRVMLRFQNTTPKKEEEMIEYLIKHPNTFWIAACTGRWDLIIDFLSRNITEFDSIIQEFLERYFDFISQKEIATIVKSAQYTRSFLLKDSEHIEFKKSYGGTPKEKSLDNIDKKILKIITNNPIMSNVEIGKTLKIDRNTVKNRINRMIKEGLIFGFRGWLEIPSIGYHSYKLMIRLNKIRAQVENKLLSFARLNPNIIYFNKILGDWDFEYDLETQNEDEFHSILNEIKNIFSQEIKDYEILKINKNFKVNYLPPI